jgi:hypothetical protein
MKKVAKNFKELFKEEREKQAERGIDALLTIYHKNRTNLPQPVIDICEKYFVDYWDVHFATKSYAVAPKEKRTSKKKTAPAT